MANAIKWITNVGKSVSYSLIDELKASNPTLSSFKDDNHIRECFAVKEDKKTIYVNIATTNKIYYVKDITGSLKKQIDGRKKSMQKANKRVKILEGQINVEDLSSIAK